MDPTEEHRQALERAADEFGYTVEDLTKLIEIRDTKRIDASDNIEFRTHVDVMSYLFGVDARIDQASFHIRHPWEPETRIWFATFYDDDRNDWTHIASGGYSRVFEKKKVGNDEHMAELFAHPEWHRRILFAKTRSGDRECCKFKGV